MEEEKQSHNFYLPRTLNETETAYIWLLHDLKKEGFILNSIKNYS